MCVCSDKMCRSGLCHNRGTAGTEDGEEPRPVQVGSEGCSSKGIRQDKLKAKEGEKGANPQYMGNETTEITPTRGSPCPYPQQFLSGYPTPARDHGQFRQLEISAQKRRLDTTAWVPLYLTSCGTFLKLEN